MTDRYVLGISAFYHDSAAAILKNGRIVAAAQEERFSRKKHDPRFPVNAINYCLEEAYIEPDEIDAIAFYDNPLLTWDRIVTSCSFAGESSSATFESALKSVFGSKVWLHDYLMKNLGTVGKLGKIIFCGHHMSHAASCFYPSPFQEAAILTVDGVGEWSTTTIALGKNHSIEVLKEINFPSSLGLLYSAFTYYCGFKINSGEYKLMGLAPYGKPTYVKKIYEHLIDVKEDGSYRLNQDYFGFLDGSQTINEKFCELFEGKARLPESRITSKEMDLAASIQVVAEEIVVKMARTAKRITGSDSICLAGGVALNCVANGKLLKENIFENMWIQPAAGDAGGALGAALIGWHQVFNESRRLPKEGELDLQLGSYLGPKFSNLEIKTFLSRNGYPAHFIEDSKLWSAKIASELADGKIVGFFTGRMEFGPRSLGARSIIGDARNQSMQSVMNLKIKFRESFRPFAPAVLAEDVSEYFDLNTSSPYMLLVAPVSDHLLVNDSDIQHVNGEGDDMIHMINKVRSAIPAVTHVDNSARIQTVHKETNPAFYDVISSFKELTGSSVLVNTSFNVRGEPIVCTPLDAYRCFMRTDMDVLVLENYIIYKTEQPGFEDVENWREEFKLD
jgi:carbamoyltransferase